MKTLRPYQKKALGYSLREEYPALFLDMRLGKTLIAIRRLAMLGPNAAVLIVAPNSALASWEREIEEEFFEAPVTFLQGTRSVRLKALREPLQGFYLINKEGWRSLPEIAGARACPTCLGAGKIAAKACRACSGIGFVGLSSCPFDAVVFDESTALKNPKARITKFFTKFFRDVPLRMILSGSPNPESDLDIFEQFRFLDSGRTFGRNFWIWRIQNFNQYGFDWSPKRGTREEIARKLSERAFVLRRQDVAIKESKVYQKRTVELPPTARKAYEEAEESFILEFAGLVKETKTSVVVYSMLRQFAAGFFPGEDKRLLWTDKFKELKRILDEELTGEPVVVWFAYNQEIDAAVEIFKKESPKVVRGDVKPEDRRRIERDFRSGKVRIIFAQVECSKHGTNFSAADTAIYFSRPLSLETRLQSEDRIVDYERRYPALIIDLVTRETIDEDVLVLLQEKKLKSIKLFELAKVIQERRSMR